MALNFCYDSMLKKDHPFSNVYKTDFKNNISPVNHEWAGYYIPPGITDEEMESGNKRFDLLYRVHTWLLKPYFDINVRTVESMKNIDEKYYYVIDVFTFSFWRCEEAKFPNLPKQVVDDINNNKAKILVLFVQEALRYNDNEKINNIFNQWVKTYNLPNHSVVVSSGSYNFEIKDKEHIIYIPFSFWQIKKSKVVKLFELSLKAIEMKMKRNHVFLCYNRRPHLHRQKLVYSLHKKCLLEYGLVSLGKVKDLNGIDSEIPPNFFDMLPLTFDDTNLEQNQAINYFIKDYLNTYISVVTETLYEHDLFPSEKIYKAIIMGHPFLVLSSKGFLKMLKDMGYQTFDKWFDESYDNEDSLSLRIKKITRETQRISQMPKDEIGNMLFEMMPVIKHNFEKYMADIKDRNFQTMLEDAL